MYYQKLTILVILKRQSQSIKKKKTFLGDLNARTGPQGKSQHNFDNHLQHFLPETGKLPSGLDRCSCDDKINA